MDLKTLLLFVASAALPSLLIAWLAAFVIRSRAERWGLIDHPGEARKVHSSPTPLGGGLAIWLGVVITFSLGQGALLLILAQPEGAAIHQWTPDFAEPHLAGILERTTVLWSLLAAGTVLMILGLVDDIRGLNWKIRLAVQFAVAIYCVFWQGWRFTAFIPLPGVTAALSVIWIVALINSFNMLDNMDGLSAGVAAIAAGILAAVMMTVSSNGGPQLFIGGFLIVIIGGLLGFLLHNRPPAKMFMGDSGSYFVGFCIAIATLLATYSGYRSTSQHAVFAPLCVMAVPLYDMMTVLWIRIREGQSPFQADKNHFSHRLVDLGLTKKQAVLTIYLTTATCGLGALLLPRVDLTGAGMILLMILCVLALIAILESSARRKLKQ